MDWEYMASCVCEILTKVYVEQREAFEKAAEARGITLEQLATAAIVEMIRELPRQAN